MHPERNPFESPRVISNLKVDSTDRFEEFPLVFRPDYSDYLIGITIGSGALLVLVFVCGQTLRILTQAVFNPAVLGLGIFGIAAIWTLFGCISIILCKVTVTESEIKVRTIRTQTIPFSRIVGWNHPRNTTVIDLLLNGNHIFRLTSRAMSKPNCKKLAVALSTAIGPESQLPGFHNR